MATFKEEVLADDPVAFWRFSEYGGNKLVDVSGNGHDGVVHGEPVRNVSNPVGDGSGAYTFLGDEADTYITIPHKSDLAIDGPITMEIVIGRDVFEASTSQYLWILGNGLSNDPFVIYTLYYGGAYRFYFARRTTESGAVGQGYMSPTLPETDFIHMAMTNVPSTQAYTTYLNGVVRYTGHTSPDAHTVYTHEDEIYIGRYTGTNPSMRPLTGSIAELAIYDTELSTERIAAHYDALTVEGSGATPGVAVQQPNLQTLRSIR